MGPKDPPGPSTPIGTQPTESDASSGAVGPRPAQEPDTDGDALTMRSKTRDHAIATWRNILLLIWRRRTTSAGTEDLEHWLGHMRTEYPGGSALLTIVEQSAPAPSSLVRRKLATVMGDAEWLRASSVTFEGKGFRAVLVRTVAAGLNKRAKMPFPHVVHASVEEASAWLAGEMNAAQDPPLTTGELLAAVEAMRKDYVL